MSDADLNALLDQNRDAIVARVTSIRRMLASGKLQAFRPVRGRVLIDREQLDSVITASTSTPRRRRGIRLATGTEG